jgi:hypothetical protein
MEFLKHIIQVLTFRGQDIFDHAIAYLFWSSLVVMSVWIYILSVL